VLLLDKPLGGSSNQVLQKAKWLLRAEKAGHTGTLDPLATGVLVVAIGRATKSIDRLMAGEKRYETTIDLSAFTTTDDSEGERTEVPAGAPSIESVRDADEVIGLIGLLEQVTEFDELG
jgi:tRNA pseudouridine55 synthase